MLRKALILGMFFILALSVLAVSMITCFTYDAGAHMGPDEFDVVNIDAGHGHFTCKIDDEWVGSLHATVGDDCFWTTQ